MRGRVVQILQGRVVGLVHVRAVFQGAAKIEMTVFLEALVGGKQRVAEGLQRFIIVPHLERSRARVEFHLLLLG